MKASKSRKKKPTYCGRTRRAKIRYRSLKDAKGARHSLEQRSGKPARIYGCPDCGGYHLTTEPGHEHGNTRTVWKTPDRDISSRKEEGSTEEGQDE